MPHRPLDGGSPPSAAMRVATLADIPAVVALMDRAYRAGGLDAGWTTEAGYIAGSRTTASLIREEMLARPDAALLLHVGDGGLLGCVRVEPRDGGTWYLGSLAIEPRQQNRRLGRALLAEAEDWIRTRGGREVAMTVVHLRAELIAWYRRRGYDPTGETEPFPYGDDRFGVPRRDDLHFVALRKAL